jgi:2'-5' RNA ligase
MSKKLYLIALVPHAELREKIKQLKLEMKERFNASHALKAPAHITLQMPFRRPEDEEEAIIAGLTRFCSTRHPFDVHLDGFDAFPPRVLFVKVKNHKPVLDIHAAFHAFLRSELTFSDKEIMDRFHPHMTIATRDLSKKMFHKAWPEFQDRVFEALFTADSLHLLKHNGKHWEMYREFGFG